MFFGVAAEHSTALRTIDEKNPLVKQQIIDHPQEAPEFCFKVVRIWKSTLAMQIGEAHAIEQEDPSNLVNSISKWGANNGIPIITIQDTRPPNTSQEQAHQGDRTLSHRFY